MRIEGAHLQIPCLLLSAYIHLVDPFPAFQASFPREGQGKSYLFSLLGFPLKDCFYPLAPPRGKGAQRAGKGSSFLFLTSVLYKGPFPCAKSCGEDNATEA